MKSKTPAKYNHHNHSQNLTHNSHRLQGPQHHQTGQLMNQNYLLKYQLLQPLFIKWPVRTLHLFMLKNTVL